MCNRLVSCLVTLPSMICRNNKASLKSGAMKKNTNGISSELGVPFTPYAKVIDISEITPGSTSLLIHVRI